METKDYIGLAVGAALAIFVIFVWPHQTSVNGQGQVNLFPSSDSVKNYRLEATMTRTEYQHGFFHSRDEYSSIEVEWPNGGRSSFSCTVVDDERTLCSDQDDTMYGIEVISAPEMPSSEYDY